MKRKAEPSKGFNRAIAESLSTDWPEAQAAIDLMRSTGMRSWFNMIRVGSTIFLEFRR